MPNIHLCFLWHMHQPFYKDLISGEYKLPWTRLHALKDYFGMAHLLEEFPGIRQTFNLVPSMMVQVEEYAAGKAADPFLEKALLPAESLTDADREFLLRHSFYSDPQRMIYRYPRYGELFDARNAQRSAYGYFGVQEFRDLQMWSQLAWFDEEFQANDPEVREWIRRGRDFTLADQVRMGEKQQEIIGRVLPEYQKLARCGQIEISTTPYYHPILPLLCDSDIASTAHPGVPLPPRFRYPQDAHRQLLLAREYIEQQFGAAPAGLWPSEGSVSDEVLTLAADLGFRWAATDSGILHRTLSQPVTVDRLYRPYEWRQNGRNLGMVFRDHFLSDLIGFVYSKMDAEEAAHDFLRRIRENCASILNTGRDALVPIILDGENAWEYYPQNGRPFLRALYRRIQDDSQLRTVTVSEAFDVLPPEPLDHIFPGSWINANFDVWIGAEEDNQAWTLLLRARQTLETVTGVSEERRRMAFEELMIAEGSDWCWWYGPEHDSAHRLEFDQLYRSHLANVYRFLNLDPPEELSRPILRVSIPAERIEPCGAIRPRIDGEVTSYFEWIGAGIYRISERSGAMHGGKPVAKEVHFGTDGQNLFLRVDFHSSDRRELAGMQARLRIQSRDHAHQSAFSLLFSSEGVQVAEPVLASGEAPDAVEFAFSRILEIRIPLTAAGIPVEGGVKIQISFWKDGLPLDAIPPHGWLEMPTTDPAELGL
jgi:alpha-amylase/alpha-mannosidase (GH57 family)